MNAAQDQAVRGLYEALITLVSQTVDGSHGPTPEQLLRGVEALTATNEAFDTTLTKHVPGPMVGGRELERWRARLL